MRNVVEYRALRDLQRGFRVTLPNLEQTGLVRVVYPMATTLARLDDRWDGSHPALETLHPEQREEVVTVLLDELRRVLAVDAEALTQDNFDKLKRESREFLAGVLAVAKTLARSSASRSPSRQTGQRSLVLNLTGHRPSATGFSLQRSRG